jgi:hypothetical protein
MRTRVRRVVNRAVAMTLISAMPAWAVPLQDPFAGLASVPDDRLEGLRGGFENSQGMQFSFAIERAIVVNGELIASTRLVLSDLPQLLAGGAASAQFLTSARSILQNGQGNTIVPAPAGIPTPPGTASPLAAAPAAAPAAVQAASEAAGLTTPAPAASAPVAGAPASVAAAPAPILAPAPAAQAAGAASASAQAAPAASSIGPLFVQMNAGGQTVIVPNASAIVTAVQNTVNDQIIQARTTIDAALSSISALRTNTLTQAVRQQALDSVRRP